MPCIFKLEMHHRCLRIMSCICCGVYHVLIVVFDLLLLDRVPKPLRSVRIRSTTLVRLLHGLNLLPSGISGKMTISLDTITIIVMLDVSFLSLVSLPTTCLLSLPKCHEKPLTPPYPSKPLFGYVTTCSALLIALLVAGAIVSMCNMDILIYHNIIAI